MATKQDLRRATFARLAELCKKVAECPNANSETGSKALELRKLHDRIPVLCKFLQWPIRPEAL